ncbi:MAG: radical SAM protein [Candidatus Hodarchaeota archaeon]
MTFNRKPILSPSYYIRKEHGGYVLFYANPIETYSYKLLNTPETVTLGLLDGDKSVDDIAAMLSKVTHLPLQQSKIKVEQILNHYSSIVTTHSQTAKRNTVPLMEFAQSEAARLLNKKYVQRFSAPLRLYFSVYPFCNSSCQYCYSSPFTQMRSNDGLISLEKIDAIFQEAYELGCMQVAFGGGDPLLHPKILSIMKLAKEHGLHFSASTKIRVTHKFCEDLASVGLEQIQVSIDSLNPKICEDLCGPGSLSNAMQTINEFLKTRIKIKVNVVLTAKNIDTVEPLVDKMLELGIDTVSLSSYTQPATEKISSLLPTKQQTEQLKKTLSKRYTDWERYVDVQADFESETCEKLAFNPDIPLSKRKCLSGRIPLFLAWQGKCFFCERIAHLPETEIGDLNQESLLEVWNGDKLLHFFHPAQSLYTGTPCYSCSRFNECASSGKCYYKSYLKYGSIYAEDFNCGRERTRA